MFLQGIEKELWHNTVTTTTKIDKGVSSKERVYIKQIEVFI